MSRRLSAETRAASAIVITSLLASCASPDNSTATPTKELPEATPTSVFPIDERIKIVPSVILANSDGVVQKWVDSNFSNACQLLVNNETGSVYMRTRPSGTLGIGTSSEDLGSFSTDRPDEIIDVEEFCRERGFDTLSAGEFNQLYLVGSFEPKPKGKKVFEVIYKMSLQTLADYREVLSHYTAAPYNYSASYFVVSGLKNGESLAANEYVEVSVPLSDLDGARILLQHAYVLFGKEGTSYLQRISYDTCAGTACYQYSGEIGLSSEFNGEDENWKQRTSIHELMHLLTPHLTSYLYTPEDSLRMEALLNRIVFQYNPMEVYAELYSDVDNDVYDRNPYWILGSLFKNRHIEFDYSPDTPGLADIFDKYDELGGDNINDKQTLQLGKYIFEYAFAHPEVQLPPDIVDALKFAYDAVLSEVFAVIGEEVLIDTESKYANDPVIRESYREFLSIALNRDINLEELVEQLRHPDGILPYKLVPIEQP